MVCQKNLFSCGIITIGILIVKLIIAPCIELMYTNSIYVKLKYISMLCGAIFAMVILYLRMERNMKYMIRMTMGVYEVCCSEDAKKQIINPIKEANEEIAGK